MRSFSKLNSSFFPLPATGRGIAGDEFRRGAILFAAPASVLFLAVLLSAFSAHAATITETFATDPLQRGWRTHGDASLFQWNATNENLEVTWDSSRTNSYFWLPLGNVLSKVDDFSIAFDLRLRDIANVNTNKPYTFEIALGFLRPTNAMATNFFRGAGQSASGPRNLVEFNYFPDSGYGATFAGTITTTNNVINFNSGNHPLEITPGDLFHIVMSFTASARVLRTVVTKNGAPFGLPPSNTLYDTVLLTNQDFRVEAVGVMSYSDAVQVGSPVFWGSVLAHGIVDNLVVTLPDPPVRNLSGARSNEVWRAQFLSRTNWLYTLERSFNFQDWSVASSTNSGTGGPQMLQDTNASAISSYYRVRAVKP